MIHFGTDGIRGKANEDLTIDMAYKIGQYLAYNCGKDCRIIIGRDTRLSGSMLQMGLAGGITSLGGNAYILDVCSTPELVYLCRVKQFDAGLMISASHNPYYDNGIKVIAKGGTKMEKSVEDKIEEYMYSASFLPLAVGEDIGEVIDYKDGLQLYCDYLVNIYPDLDLTGKRLLLDLANGSATVTAKRVLSALGAECDVINGNPNGVNINRNCGSTHPETLSKMVVEGNYDAGLAFDGDADRLIAVAPDGQLVDGDKTIYCCGKYLMENGLLTGGKVVTTVMANLGLFKKLDQCGIGYEKTKVGDKYVYENMCANGYILGGEQSGHIIFSKHASTGDGLLTAIELLNVCVKTGKNLNQLTDDLFVYPQLLINVTVKDKEKSMNDPDVLAKCAEVEQLLAGNGRVLVRCSGTEPLVRVMVEAGSDELCEKYCQMIVDVVKEKEN